MLIRWKPFHRVTADDEFAEIEFDEEYDNSGGNDGGDM